MKPVRKHSGLLVAEIHNVFIDIILLKRLEIKMKKIFWILSLLMLSAPAFCDDQIVYGTKINRIYAQSKEGSTAHLIRVDATLPAQCNDHRLYIDFEDSDLFAFAMANYMAGKTVNIVYNTSSAKKIARTHWAMTCKLISIF